MIPFIRSASPGEIDSIKDKADLTPTSAVWSWPNDNGSVDLAVIRRCVEVDPVIFAETSGNSRKALFFWSLVNMLKMTDAHEVYFDIDAEGSEQYQVVLEKLGAVKTTTKPQFRYKLGF